MSEKIMDEKATIGDVIIIAIIVVVIIVIIKGCFDDSRNNPACKCKYYPGSDDVFCTYDDGSICDPD